jgi:hypothetical protein
MPRAVKLLIVIAVFIFPLSAVIAETARPIEIRFCPSSIVRTYPLESRRELQSLMLQNMAVVNHGTAPLKIDNIELELLQAGQVLDSKKLDDKLIQHFSDRGAKMQQAGVLHEVAFQFCGTDLIAPGIKLGGR